MTDSLSQPISKKSQADKKEPIDIVRYMIDLLSQPINEKLVKKYIYQKLVKKKQKINL